MTGPISGATVTAPDEETTALLAATTERILADLCTPALLRAAEGAQGETAVGGLWRALETAGLSDALRADEGGDGALGWPQVRPVLEACGRWGVPVPLAESLAAQALARQAGAVLVAGPASLAVARLDGGRVIAEPVAYPRLVERVIVSLPDAGGRAHRLWSFEASRASVDGAVGIADARAAMSWSLAEGAELGGLPAGVTALLTGAAVRSAQIAGACAQVLEMAARYASDRVQFGRPIGKFQAIQQQLSVAGEWTAMASMASQLALVGPGLALDRERVASAKQVAGTAAQLCAEIAHAVHGAIGVTAEYDLQLFTRRLWAWAADFGSSLYWARQLGTELVEHAPRYSWDTVVRASSV